MTNEEAEKYAKVMTYRDAVYNALQGKCIPYRKATLIKLYELLDRLEQQPCEDCISRQAVIILIDEASEMHPYKVVGDSDTYSNYNQGWSDACDWLYANIEGVPFVTPQTVTEFADKCKECGKIQNEFFNFDAPMVKNSEAVSREAVIRLVEQYPNIIGNRCSGLISDIKHLPPATPERPKGKWIEVGSEDNPAEHHFECSECGNTLNWLDEYDHYCRNCGSKNWEG